MSVFFGDFALDQERRQLLRSGEPVPLGAKPYELLSLLVARRPRVLSKAQISGVLWPGTSVGETSLPRLVTDLRQALGDDPQRPRFIRTAHGFGYAFCGEAREDGQPRTAGSGGGQAGTARAVDLSRTPAEERPYPGLSAFTENEAEQFFGREAEVASLWERVRGQKLLALIGPSGVGKTSFVRAGVIAHQPEGWATVYMTPGANPVGVLARELTPKLTSAPLALADLVQGATELVQSGDAARVVSAASRWRLGAKEALLVIDQFEELFALNAEETQGRFAMLLGRLTEEAGIHVLLSLRDDFLFRCHSFPALSPAFDHVTPLGPPSSEALRRALVEPAARHGARFEDEALVEEMVETVAKERGALPLLAFAASRLWEERDRERKLLAREAYERIGGVAGALVQHAEATLADIGADREGLVRELFRNLVTAEGTRAAREREELLSVFAVALEKREEAEAVLDVLVGSRLLTEYDPQEEREGQGCQRIEIVHESLLTGWPRLERWRAQDEEGAVLRDQFRQAARLWQDRGRPEDLLWSGTAYRDFAVWKERYPGGLSATEDAFAVAAARRAGRKRRQRRIAAATLFAALCLGLGVVATFWGRAETSRHKAEAEALRAEASKLLALGQVELEQFPTAAVAYALKSLELADTREARLFALRALQRAPTATVTSLLSLDSGAITQPAFSPDGQWLAFGGWRKVELFRREGGPPLIVGGDNRDDKALSAFFGPRSDVLLARRDSELRVWSLPEGRDLRREIFEGRVLRLWPSEDGFLTATAIGSRWLLQRHFRLGGVQGIGSMAVASDLDVDVEGGFLAFARGRGLYIRSLDRWASPPRLLAEHSADVASVAYSPDRKLLVATDKSGETRIWPARPPAAYPVRIVRTNDARDLVLDSSGRFLAGIGKRAGRVMPLIWDLTAPPGAEPLALGRADAPFLNWLAFEPGGRWLAVSNAADGTLWAIAGPYPHVLTEHEESVNSLAFSPDGRTLLSASHGGTLRSWPLSPESRQGSRVLVRTDLFFPALALDSASRFAVLNTGSRHLKVPLDGGPMREVLGLDLGASSSGPLALEGKVLAAAPYMGPEENRFVRIVDLETGAIKKLPSLPGLFDPSGAQFCALQFAGPDRLLATVFGTGLLDYDVGRGSSRILDSQPQWHFAVAADGHVGVGVTSNPELAAAGQASQLVRFRLDGTPAQTLPSHGTRVSTVALDPSARVVATGSVDGTVRIGSVSGDEPHVFFGHEGVVWTMAFSPDGRFVASGGNDGSIRLWPVPDLSKPPPHIHDRERFLNMLRKSTNLRAVPDPKSATGWKIDRDPFPGWAKVPEW